MATGAKCEFSPGGRVILDSTGECGVVVHAWVSDDLGGLEDCYVAFFGAEFPEPGRAPTEPPYILRYAARSLRRAPPSHVDDVLAAYVLGHLTADDLKATATEMILGGRDSPSLAALAGAERSLQPADLRDLFEQALREMGEALPTRLAAGTTLKSTYARQVVSGKLKAREGARRIVVLAQDLSAELPGEERYVGEAFGIATLVGLYYSFDDLAEPDPAAIKEIEDEITRVCASIARGEDANPPA